MSGQPAGRQASLCHASPCPAQDRVPAPPLPLLSARTFSSFRVTGGGLAAVTAAAISAPMRNASSRVRPGSTTNMLSAAWEGEAGQRVGTGREGRAYRRRGRQADQQEQQRGGADTPPAVAPHPCLHTPPWLSSLGGRSPFEWQTPESPSPTAQSRRPVRPWACGLQAGGAGGGDGWDCRRSRCCGACGAAPETAALPSQLVLPHQFTTRRTCQPRPPTHQKIPRRCSRTSRWQSA